MLLGLLGHGMPYILDGIEPHRALHLLRFRTLGSCAFLLLTLQNWALVVYVEIHIPYYKRIARTAASHKDKIGALGQV